MPVPAVLAARTSPSPAKVPPAIDTVADTRSRLSGSVTEAAGDKVTVWLAVKATLAAAVSVGGSLIAVMLTVVVCAVERLNEPAPSLSTQVMVRVGVEP